MKTGRIIRSLSGYYDIAGPDGEVLRARARGEFRKSKQKPLVGDEVDFDSQSNDGFIWKIHPRKNSLVRPPIANLDRAVIVTAVREPNFTANLLDRQLVALEAAKVPAGIYFSKMDLLTEEERADFASVIADYQKIGYPVLVSDQDESQQWGNILKDQVTVFMGQTGAGKSTLLNQLCPGLGLEVGEVSKALSRGKHTTRQVALLPIPKWQTWIADTPGFSSYEVFDFPVTDLDQYFPEFRALRGQCRFRGCVHINEPGCAIKEAVTLGTISASRYNSYKTFYNLMANKKIKYR
ncbi:ribosome small subunit-dependent GTPase A [Lactobacillaceae bacterium L1_55_11]|nr:ribosome small subunit-dependent GTPase A [Lactobacillaceae bacterium L1_55_11]